MSVQTNIPHDNKARWSLTKGTQRRAGPGKARRENGYVPEGFMVETACSLVVIGITQTDKRSLRKPRNVISSFLLSEVPPSDSISKVDD